MRGGGLCKGDESWGFIMISYWGVGRTWEGRCSWQEWVFTPWLPWCQQLCSTASHSHSHDDPTPMMIPPLLWPNTHNDPTPMMIPPVLWPSPHDDPTSTMTSALFVGFHLATGLWWWSQATMDQNFECLNQNKSFSAELISLGILSQWQKPSTSHIQISESKCCILSLGVVSKLFYKANLRVKHLVLIFAECVLYHWT